MASEVEGKWKIESNLNQTNPSEIPSEYQSQTHLLQVFQLPHQIPGDLMSVYSSF